MKCENDYLTIALPDGISLVEIRIRDVLFNEVPE